MVPVTQWWIQFPFQTRVLLLLWDWAKRLWLWVTILRLTYQQLFYCLHSSFSLALINSIFPWPRSPSCIKLMCTINYPAQCPLQAFIDLLVSLIQSLCTSITSPHLIQTIHNKYLHLNFMSFFMLVLSHRTIHITQYQACWLWVLLAMLTHMAPIYRLVFSLPATTSALHQFGLSALLVVYACCAQRTHLQTPFGFTKVMWLQNGQNTSTLQ